MGFKKSKAPKTTTLQLRLKQEEKAEIQAKADDCMMSLSEFVLRAALGRQTRTQHDLHLVTELCRVADLLREIYHAEKPREASELEPVLNAVVKAIDRIGEESRLRL